MFSYFLHLGSSYTIRVGIKNLRGLELSLGYSISGNEVSKVVYYLELRRSKNEVKLEFPVLMGLSYLSEVNAHSPIHFKLVKVVRPYPEMAAPYMLTPAHLSLKKMHSIEPRNEYYKLIKYIDANGLYYDIWECIKEIISLIGVDEGIIKGFTKIIVLYMVAFLSGIHRYSLALRQAAFQSIVHFYLKLLSKDISKGIPLGENLLRAISSMLATLMGDTYIWVPYMMLKKVGAHGSELIYTVAANPIREVLHSLEDKEPRDVLCLLKNFNAYARKRIEGVLKSISKSPSGFIAKPFTTLGEVVSSIHRTVKDVVSEFYGVSIRRESLIGRCMNLVDALHNRAPMYKGNGKNAGLANGRAQILLTATEQLNPLILDAVTSFCKEFICDDIKGFDVLLVFTPQTYINYLITKDLVRHLCEKIVNIKGYVIPATEGLLSKVIASSIVREIDGNSLAIALIQGGMIETLPLYLELRKLLGKQVECKVVYT